MGKSFVFKDENGRVGGYLMQSMGILRFRIQGFSGQQARVTLLMEDGRHTAFEGRWDDSENERANNKEGNVMGAYITIHGKPVLFTDEHAHSVCTQALLNHAVKHTESVSKQQTDGQKPSRDQEKRQMDSKSTMQEREAEKLRTAPNVVSEQTAQSVPMQPRWPPPPCLKKARYVQGSWQEESQ